MRERLKVVLVVNNFSWFGKRAFHTWLPSVPIITALLKNETEFLIIDANVNAWTFEETREEIRKTAADIVLISALSVDYQLQYHKVAELAKQALPGVTVVCGGVYPTVLPEQVLRDRNIDFVIQGYAEERLARIINLIGDNAIDVLKHEEGVGFRLRNKICLIPFYHYLCEVKKIVRPDYSYLDIEKYFQLQKEYNAQNYTTECAEKRSVNIIASYGCPYNCFFCANRNLSNSRIVYRPLEDVLDEINFFVKTYKVQQISFMDDNIVADKSRAKKLFQEIINREYRLEIQIGNLAAWDLDDEMLELMKQAGCTRIGISVESGSCRVLKEIIHKPLNLEIIPQLVMKFKQLNIIMVADFIIGLPGETWEEIRQTFDYAYTMDADLCNFNIAVPYPGTDMYYYMKAHHMLPADFAFDETFFWKGLVHTKEFSPSELKMLQACEWERVNLGTKRRKARAMKALRLSESEIEAYAKQMRKNAIRFIKNHS